MKQKAPGLRIRIAVLGVLLVGAGAALWYWREPLWALFGNQAAVQEWVASFGPWGPLVSVGLNAAQVLLAPVPGQIIGLINGYLYGVGLGTLYSMLGLLLGSATAMALGRYFGRPLVERLVSPATLAKWDRIAANRGLLFFFLVFLIPGLPDDIVCFVVGLSPLSIARVVALAMIGRLPGVFVSSWVGARATDLPLWAWIPLIAGTAGLAWLFLRHQARLEAIALRAIHRLAPRRSPGPAHELREPQEDYPASD